MADSPELTNLKRLRELLVGHRRDQAANVQAWEGYDEVSPGVFKNVYAVQEAIEAVDRAIKDERKLSKSAYNLDNLG